LIFGDTSHVTGVELQSSNYVKRAMGARSITDLPPIGSVATQNLVEQSVVVALTTTAAAAASQSIASVFAQQAGHSYAFTLEWTCRDKTSGASYMASTVVMIENTNTAITGSAVSFGATGDGTLSTATCTITWSGATPQVTVTPPAAYANNMDWTVRARWLAN
jgi:hypothetical protein